jgi:hypothetical protein
MAPGASARRDPIGRSGPGPVGGRWRDRQHLGTLGPDHLPAALVHRPVMTVAEQRQIGDLGVPAVAPVADMVPVNPPMYVDNE